jgi:uncharacterized protein
MNIDWPHFTPYASALGGTLLGLAAAMLVLFNGRVAGVSGIVGSLLHGDKKHSAWRIAFIAGLLLAPLAYGVVTRLPAVTIDADYGLLILAGLLVGIGTQYSAGCTSGHGVCGISRLSVRSLVATLTFMGAGFLTVAVLRHCIA